MIKIRKNCFETNSSSTHAICIPQSYGIIPHQLFYVGEYGWRADEVPAASYLYTCICDCCYTEEEYDRVMSKLTSILNKNNISYTIKQPQWIDCTWKKGTRCFSEGHIDHPEEFYDLVKIMLEDENLLLRYLGGARVFTGNDNDDYCSGYVHNYADLLMKHDYYIYWKTN